MTEAKIAVTRGGVGEWPRGGMVGLGLPARVPSSGHLSMFPS